MPVEMRLEDAETPAPASSPALSAPPAAEAGTAPAILRDLIAARLVTHEAIGDPDRLAGEEAALQAICALVAGPVYRLEPFHYAFAARPQDLGGRLAALAPEARTAALEAALAGSVGSDAVWLGATDLLPGEASLTPEARARPLPEAALLVLRAQDAAVAGGVAAADPALRAVIDARLAAETARGAAGIAAALGLEIAVEVERGLAAGVERGLAALETRLAARLATALADRAAETDAAAARAAAAETAARRAFEARVGLALAEFLARIERRADQAASAS